MSETYDIAVVGGSLGGVAAALAAADAGASVVLSEASDWLGGQLTNQGVSAPDEHQYVERFGPTSAYAHLREGIRERYRERHEVVVDEEPLNPGNCWVSKLGFEPEVGVEVIDGLLSPHVDAGRLTVLRNHEPVDVTTAEDRVESVTLDGPEGERDIAAEYVLDATDLGQLLPLTNTEYVTGAESRAQTGEPGAKDEPAPNEVQSFTFCFAVEHRPGEDHVIEKPAGYERFRDEQPYTFEYEVDAGDVSTYRMFEEGPEGERPFWTYRRLIDADQFADRERDVAMINWKSNDYYFRNPIDEPRSVREEIYDEARRLARGFLYWLQTEAPRDDGGRGYPGLKLLPSVMGTEHGLSKRPYIRESRRIVPEERVVEGDVAADENDGGRGRPFPDSVGIGHYPIDVHSCVGNPEVSVFRSTKPFRVPLRALLPAAGPSNLLPACKNIGTTHITNGCYRLHPIEWNVGESAGALAAFCLDRDLDPPVVRRDRRRLRTYQYRLLSRGVPLAWTVDVPQAHEHFVPTQLLAVAGGITPGSKRHDGVEIYPDEPLSDGELSNVVEAAADVLGRTSREPSVWESASDGGNLLSDLDRLGADSGVLGSPPTWSEVCAALEPAIERRFSSE